MQFAGTFTLALVIGITAILVILSIAVLGASNGLFKQNAPATVSIDAGYTLAIGAIMIAAQGIF